MYYIIKEMHYQFGDEKAVVIATEPRGFWKRLLEKEPEPKRFYLRPGSAHYQYAERAYRDHSQWFVDYKNFSTKVLDGKDVFVEDSLFEDNYEIDDLERPFTALPHDNIIEDSNRFADKHEPEIEEAAEEELEETIINGNKLKRYLNAEKDLKSFKLPNNFSLVPFDEKYLKADIESLVSLEKDEEARKYMTGFWGPGAKERNTNYLINTIMTTDMGIAFAYAIRKNKELCGFIKVTSPDHNRVTNNCDNWLIDYLTLPEYRNQKLMKSALPILFNLMHENLHIREIYAMVVPGNDISIRLLEYCGFKIDKSKEIAPDPISGKTPFYMKLKF